MKGTTSASPPSMWMFLGHAQIIYMRNLYPGLCIQRENAMQAQETTPTLCTWGGCPHCVPVTCDGVLSPCHKQCSDGTAHRAPLQRTPAGPVGPWSTLCSLWGMPAASGGLAGTLFFSVILCSKGETLKIRICGGDKPGHKGQTTPFFCRPRYFSFWRGGSQHIFCLPGGLWLPSLIQGHFSIYSVHNCCTWAAVLTLSCVKVMKTLPMYSIFVFLRPSSSASIPAPFTKIVDKVSPTPRFCMLVRIPAPAPNYS